MEQKTEHSLEGNYNTQMKRDADLPFQEIHGSSETLLKHIEEIQQFAVSIHNLPDTENHLRFLRFPSFPESQESDNSAEEQPEIHLELMPPSANPSTTDYVAVSYVWDRPEPVLIVSAKPPPRYRIRVLEHAKSELRDPRCPYDVLHRACRFAHANNISLIWIDQECIDQNDPDDVEKHLQCVTKIYANSRHTIAMLSGMISSEEEFLALSCLCNDKLSDEAVAYFQHDHRFVDLCHKILQKIGQDPWFYRAWTYEERYSATNLHLLINRDPSLANYTWLGDSGEVDISFALLKSALMHKWGDWGAKCGLFPLVLPWFNTSISPQGLPFYIFVKEFKGRTGFGHIISKLFKTLEACHITKDSDRLAILADIGGLPNRLKSTFLNNERYSYSTCVLVLLLNNGLIPTFRDAHGNLGVCPVPLYMNIGTVLEQLLCSASDNTVLTQLMSTLHSASIGGSLRMIWFPHTNPQSELEWSPSDLDEIKEYAKKSPIVFLPTPNQTLLEAQDVKDAESGSDMVIL